MWTARAFAVQPHVDQTTVIEDTANLICPILLPKYITVSVEMTAGGRICLVPQKPQFHRLPF